MSNPYESPQYANPVAEASLDREKLRRVAKYQQWTLYALLATIVINILAMGSRVSGGLPAAASLLMGLLSLAVAVCAMVAIFLLAREVYGFAAGVICAILMLVPCISLITLLVVNGKATSYLQAHGVKVGLIGVNPETI